MKKSDDKLGGLVAGNASSPATAWDHSSHEKFYDHYARGSLGPRTMQRLRAIRKIVLKVLSKNGDRSPLYDVADIGCGAGTQSLLWAELGHRVHGVDVNAPLIELARQRAASAGYSVDFQIGTAVQLPWPGESMDICLAAELLEHVAEWEACLEEFTRVLKPGGVLFLTTSNKLCPRQHEFNLPLYSWYPAPWKHHCEQLSLTTRPGLANYAKYPAVNWFSFYSLRRWLAGRGVQCADRFDIMDTEEKGPLARWVVAGIRAMPALRFLAHVCTPDTILLGWKRGRTAR